MEYEPWAHDEYLLQRPRWQTDNFDTGEANALMAGPLFSENPFGADFDPDVLIKRLESGES